MDKLNTLYLYLQLYLRVKLKYLMQSEVTQIYTLFSFWEFAAQLGKPWCAKCKDKALGTKSDAEDVMA